VDVEPAVLPAREAVTAMEVQAAVPAVQAGVHKRKGEYQSGLIKSKGSVTDLAGVVVQGAVCAKLVGATRLELKRVREAGYARRHHEKSFIISNSK
jgi:hypothetical protein